MRMSSRGRAATCAAIFTITAAVGPWCAAVVAEPSAREIMEKADARDTGKTSRMTITMTLRSKAGSKRVREIIAYSKDFGNSERTAMSFLAPKDVAGVGYLTWSYDEKGKDDDKWLYMPAMKKVRRIAGSSNNDDFMGTDFTYEDIGSRDIDKDSFELVGSETVDGADCWAIAAKPLDTGDTAATRLLRVRKDNYVIAGAEFFDREGHLQRTLAVPEIRQIDGIWTATRMEMTNVQDGHSTVLEMKDVQYDITVDDSLFTVSAIEKGKIK
jgi:hypothetical protein